MLCIAKKDGRQKKLLKPVRPIASPVMQQTIMKPLFAPENPTPVSWIPKNELKEI